MIGLELHPKNYLSCQFKYKYDVESVLENIMNFRQEMERFQRTLRR